MFSIKFDSDFEGDYEIGSFRFINCKFRRNTEIKVPNYKGSFCVTNSDFRNSCSIYSSMDNVTYLLDKTLLIHSSQGPFFHFNDIIVEGRRESVHIKNSTIHFGRGSKVSIKSYVSYGIVSTNSTISFNRNNNVSIVTFNAPAMKCVNSWVDFLHTKDMKITSILSGMEFRKANVDLYIRSNINIWFKKFHIVSILNINEYDYAKRLIVKIDSKNTEIEFDGNRSEFNGKRLNYLKFVKLEENGFSIYTNA